MRRLTIHRLIATNFGGLQNHTLELPDDSFVVLHGPNESGKSTMAEAMAWLLTNIPEANMDVALLDRLRGTDSNLTAELDWDLDGRTYRSRGAFKLTKRTVSKGSTFEITGPDDELLDVGDLEKLLGSTDYDVFDHVFRVRGEDGHTEHEGNVSGLVQRTALGSSGGGLRSREVIGELGDRVKTLTTSKAQGAESVQALLARARQSADEFDEAGRNAEHFEELQGRLTERAAHLATLDEAVVELNDRVSELETAQKAGESFRATQRLRADLADAPAPDPGWDRFVDRLGDFDQARDARTAAAGELDEAQDALRNALDDLGSPWTPETLAEVSLTPESAGQVRKLVGSLEGQREQATTADGAIVAQRESVASAIADLETAERRWRSLETEADPDGWLAELEVAERAGAVDLAAAPALPDNEGATLPSLLALSTAVVGLVIAAVGFAAGQPLLAVLGLLVTGVGGATAWIVQRSKSSVPAPIDDGLPTIDTAGLRARREAARAVVDARSALDDSRRELAAAEERLRNRQQSATQLATQITDRLHSSGVRVPVEADGADVLADRIVRAGTARALVGKRTQVLGEAEAALDQLRILAPADWRDRSDDTIRDEADQQIERADTRTDLEEQLDTERKAYRAVVAGNDRIEQVLADTGEGALDEILHQARRDLQSKQGERDEETNEIGRLQQQLDDLAEAHELDNLRFEQNRLRVDAEEKLAEALVVAATRRLLTDVVEHYEKENRPAIVSDAERIVRKVNPAVAELRATPSGGAINLGVQTGAGLQLPDEVLSTGARALLYLSFRLAAAAHESEKRQVRLPLLLDDALVHLDDDRLPSMIDVLSGLADHHQVLLFTCHQRTVDAARARGAALLDLDD